VRSVAPDAVAWRADVRAVATLLAVLVVGYPLLIATAPPVLFLGAVAITLCALGILLAPPILVAGAVVALAEYTLALWLVGGPPRLAGAVLLGVGLLLLVETADWGRRARRATLGPGVVLSQIRYWAAFGAFTAALALGVIALATVASGARLPWAPALAAAGAVVALVGLAVALHRSRRNVPGAVDTSHYN
jgi:hypothetical protein